MSMPLLQTKLYIPPARPDWVPRPRLLDRLQAGLDGPLTLISAPAGFGKTALLSAWAAAADPPLSLAWLSLDPGDNDPRRFYTYLLTALQRVQPGLGDEVLAALQASGIPRVAPPLTLETLLSSLINELAAKGRSPILVLDDYHVITERAVHQALGFLLEQLPPHAGPGAGGLHLVVATRADPPLPLARLRARGHLHELRQADLRFTSQEAAAFLNQSMGLNLAPEDVAALEQRTEGWIVGLQLAALSLQGRPDPHAFVAAFAGDDRYVADYLVAEVLLRQPPWAQSFLLQTSILERLSAPLCDAVVRPAADVGRGSQAILEHLEQNNLFVVALDNRREWYRYHQLFADLLRRRLGTATGTDSVVLHRRASAWYEQHGLIAEAVHHALAAGDEEDVARLVAGNALAMLSHGELATVMAWLDALPGAMVGRQPLLCIARAWVLAYAGQLTSVEEAVEAATAALGSQPSTAQARRVVSHAAALRAYVADLQGALPQAIDAAQAALAGLGDEDAAVRAFTWSLLATAYRDHGNLCAAARASQAAIATSQALGTTQVTLTALCELAITQIWQGQLGAAAATCRRALALSEALAGRSGRRLPVVALAYARLSTILHERNQIQEALRYARRAVELCDLWGQADVTVIAYAALARALLARGEGEGALHAADRSVQVAHNLSPWYGRFMAGWLARLQLLLGRASEAVRWAETSGLSSHEEMGLDTENQYRTLARVLLHQGRVDEAQALLERLLATAEAAGALHQVVEIRALQTLAWDAQGRPGEALATLEAALTLAQPEGYVRTFLEAGAPLARLVRRAAARGIAPGYAASLLAAFEREAQHQHAAHQPLANPLTPRELEVLRWVATGASNPQIARELVITRNTVKKHITHIFAKLEARHRTQAVARARELGILD